MQRGAAEHPPKWRNVANRVKRYHSHVFSFLRFLSWMNPSLFLSLTFISFNVSSYPLFFSLCLPSLNPYSLFTKMNRNGFPQPVVDRGGDGGSPFLLLGLPTPPTATCQAWPPTPRPPCPRRRRLLLVAPQQQGRHLLWAVVARSRGGKASHGRGVTEWYMTPTTCGTPKLPIESTMCIHCTSPRNRQIPHIMTIISLPTHKYIIIIIEIKQ